MKFEGMGFKGMTFKRMTLGFVAALLFAATLLPGAALAQTCSYTLTPVGVDFGTHFRFTTTPGMPKRVATLQVTCSAPTRMQWVFDNEFGNDLHRFALANAGHYTVRVSHATLDDKPAQVGNMRLNHSVSNWGESVLLSRETDNGFMVGHPGLPGHMEAKYSTMTARIAFDARLDRVVDAGTGLKQTMGTFLHQPLGVATNVALSTTIVPGGCQINLSNNGVVDLGQIPYDTLNLASPTVYADRIVSVSVLCTNAIPVSFVAIENRPGTAYLVDGTPDTARRSFGVGRTSHNVPIGAYQVLLENMTVNGTPATPIAGNYVTGWTTSSPMYLKPGLFDRFIGPGDPGSGLTPITNASWNLRVKPLIAPRNSLLLRGAATINGSITLTLVYP